MIQVLLLPLLYDKMVVGIIIVTISLRNLF